MFLPLVLRCGLVVSGRAKPHKLTQGSFQWIVYGIRTHDQCYCSLFRFGSAIVALQLRTVSFLSKTPNNPLCFLIYSNRARLPQGQEVTYSILNDDWLYLESRLSLPSSTQVSLSFINNTAQVGSAMYLQYMEQCSYFGLEESSQPLKEAFRTDSYYYRSVWWLCIYNDVSLSRMSWLLTVVSSELHSSDRIGRQEKKDLRLADSMQHARRRWSCYNHIPRGGTFRDTAYPEAIWYPDTEYPRKFYTGIS